MSPGTAALPGGGGAADSFILGGFLRAERERLQLQHRAGLPGLIALPAPPLRCPPSPPARRWPYVLSGVALLAGLVAAAWLQPWQRPEPPPAVIPSAALPPSPVPTMATPTLASLASPLPEPRDLPLAEPPQPSLRVLSTSRAGAYRKTGKPKQGTVSARPAKVTKAPRATAEAGPRVYALAELPAAIQKAAKQISVAGFAQADNSKERMAIINNRALREGDELPGGLRVERIVGNSVVFNLKGYRFIKGRS